MKYLLEPAEISQTYLDAQTAYSLTDRSEDLIDYELRAVAQAQLSHAEPLIRKDEAREIYREIKALPIFPKTHDYEYWMDEVGQCQKKHLGNCKLCYLEYFFKTKYGVEE